MDDSIVFATDDVVIGTVRSLAGGRVFPRHVLVFPRTVMPLDIHYRGTLTATPASVLMCNQSTSFRLGEESFPGAYDWFGVSDSFLIDLLGSYERPVSLMAPFRFLEGAPPPAILLEERLLLGEIAAGTLDRAAVEETVLRLARAVVRAAWRAHRVRRVVTAGELEAVEGVRAWIADNPASDRLLPELAAMAGLHPLRLCRLFQYRTGMTLTQFRNRLRLSLALELMAGSAGSLFDIAYSLGYSSHAYFSDVFRKTFGMTPTDARALLKGHGDAAVIGAVSRIVAQSVSAAM